jgi:environmental stress-induced protein Ves
VTPIVTLLGPDAWRTQRWANGAGTTHEIARWGGPAFDARLSVAELDAPGPFSHFPGYDRWLAAGGPVTLVLPDGRHRLTRGEALAFAGEVDVCGEPADPTWDLNVMVRRGIAWSAEIVRTHTERGCPPGVTALFALGKAARGDVAGASVEIAPRATLLVSSAAACVVAIDARDDAPVAWVHLDLPTPPDV